MRGTPLIDRRASGRGPRPRFDRLQNFRDVGGLATLDGRRLRAGVLFRSELPRGLSVRDRSTLDALGITLVCDLRTPRESQRRPAQVGARARVVNVPMHEDARYDVGLRHLLRFLVREGGEAQFRAFARGYYRHLATDRTARIRELFELLAGSGGAPTLVHCTAGRDRTGFVVALVQWCLGVPSPDVLSHYLETNERFAPRLERLARVLRAATLRQVSEARIRTVLAAHPELLADLHRKIVERHGSVEGYLREACGIEARTLEQLRAQLLEA